MHTFVLCVGVHCWSNEGNGHLIGFAQSTHFGRDEQIPLSANVKDVRAEIVKCSVARAKQLGH